MTFWGFAAEHPGEFVFCVIVVCIALVRIVYHLRNPESARKRTIELAADFREPDEDKPEEDKE
jgi:hypothetical protein